MHGMLRRGATILVAVCSAWFVPARDAYATTGLAVGEAHPVYTFRLRAPDGKVLREFRAEQTRGGEHFTWQRDFIHAGSRVIASDGNQDGTGQGTLLFHTDQDGTPRVVTTTAGAVVARHTYH